MAQAKEYYPIQHQNVLVVGIQAPYNRTIDTDSYFEEFLNLVKTNQVEYKDAIFMRLRDIDAGYFLTKGKLDQLKELCEKHNIDQVIFSEPLTPNQEGNLCDYLDAQIFDRTRLILEIFEKAALTAEGKTQVEIAMLQHKKSRLAGKGVYLAQQAGVIGVRGGFGETAKEKERRHIEESILKLKNQLKRIATTKETQRKARLKSGVPLICLVGYTNAGKSTILNALTKSEVLAEDKLFATLDTTTRELYLNGEKKGLLSDTVGFIQLLPPKLIEAFKSTLSELHYADLLLHVVDLSDGNWEYHMKVVHKILEELEVDKPVLYVFNKVDKITMSDELQARLNRFNPHVIISAHTKEGSEPLINFLDTWKNTES